MSYPGKVELTWTFIKAFALGFGVAGAIAMGFIIGWLDGRALFDAFNRH